jgi:hypothetical protein
MTRLRAIFIISFLLLFAVSLWADTGVIGGTLTNEWGDPLIGAHVRIPGQAYLSVVRYQSGSYEISGLPAGLYDLMYEHSAYNSLLLRNVAVAEDSVTELHVILNLAERGHSVVDTVVLELPFDSTSVEPDSLMTEPGSRKVRPDSLIKD